MPRRTSRLGADERATFILEHVSDQSAYPTDLDDYVTRSFKETMNFWRDWIGRSTYQRPLARRGAALRARAQAAVRALERSIVAAVTFGLPEAIGGVRNWDYRYSWIRDASFTLYALTRLGMTVGDRRRSSTGWSSGFESSRPEDTANALHHRRRIGTVRSGPWTTWRAIAARDPYGSATPHPTSCSSTSTASCSMRSTCTTSMAGHEPRALGDGSPPWWTG